MSSTPLVSVIICTYNRENFLRCALAGYEKQSFRDFEVVVTSDGSSDGTSKFMDEYRRNAPYPLHYIWQSDDGFRKALAINKAVLAARGEILVFADDDMVPPVNYLKNYVKCFQNAPQEGVLVFTKYLPVAKDDPLFTPENIRNKKYMRRYTLFWKLHFLLWSWKYKIYFWKHHPLRPKLQGGNFAVSAAAFRAVNGLDLDFVGYGYEDNDLRRRLLAAGIRAKEAVRNTWAFNLGYEKSCRTSFGDSHAGDRAVHNAALALDASRPVRCVRGLAETDEDSIVF